MDGASLGFAGAKFTGVFAIVIYETFKRMSLWGIADDQTKGHFIIGGKLINDMAKEGIKGS